MKQSKALVNNTIQDLLLDSTIKQLWPTEDVSGLLFQLQFVGHEFLGPKHYVHRENFQSFALVFTAKGETTIFSKDESFCADENSFLFCDCTHPYTSTASLPVAPCPFSAEIYYIHVYPNEWIKSFCSLLTHDGPILKLSSDLGFISLVNEIIESADKGKIDQAYFSCKIYEFLCRLKETAETIVVPNSQAVKEVKQFIADRFSDKITIADCASLVHLSPNYLESLFAQVTGSPIATYLANVRFHKSAELIVSTNMSLSEIAEAVGLNDARTLIRLYKKKTGVTPGAFRKSKRNIKESESF